MNPLTLTGQIFGFCAMALIILSFQFRDNRRLFMLQIGSCLFFTLNFLFLGLGGDASAYSGMAQNLLGLVFRAVIVLGGRFRKLNSPVTMSVIAAAMAALAVFTYSGNPVSLLPVVGNFLCLGGMWTGDANVIRAVQLAAVSPAWLTYNIFLFSIAGILVESFNIVSIIVYYIRAHMAKKKEAGKENDESKNRNAGRVEGKQLH